MEKDSLTTRQKWILAAGILLVVNLLFVPWYRAGGFVDVALAQVDGFGAGFYAWFGSLCAIGAAAILALKATGRGRVGAWQVKAEYVALGLAAVGFVLILIRLITESSSVFIGTILGLIVSVGLTVGLLAEAGITLPKRAPGEAQLPPPPPPPPPA